MHPFSNSPTNIHFDIYLSKLRHYTLYMYYVHHQEQELPLILMVYSQYWKQQPDCNHDCKYPQL